MGCKYRRGGERLPPHATATDRVSFSKVRRETRATQVISGCHSGSSWCRRPRPIDASGDAAGGCRRGGARRRAWPVFHAGWAGSASPGPAGHFGGPREAVLLTMQGIGGQGIGGGGVRGGGGGGGEDNPAGPRPPPHPARPGGPPRPPPPPPGAG